MLLLCCLEWHCALTKFIFFIKGSLKNKMALRWCIVNDKFYALNSNQTFNCLCMDVMRIHFFNQLYGFFSLVCILFGNDYKYLRQYENWRANERYLGHCAVLLRWLKSNLKLMCVLCMPKYTLVTFSTMNFTIRNFDFKTGGFFRYTPSIGVKMHISISNHSPDTYGYRFRSNSS